VEGTKSAPSYRSMVSLIFNKRGIVALRNGISLYSASYQSITHCISSVADPESDPDPLVRGTDPDPAPHSSIIIVRKP
jgi:hypothetical protein